MICENGELLRDYGLQISHPRKVLKYRRLHCFTLNRTYSKVEWTKLVLDPKDELWHAGHSRTSHRCTKKKLL